MNEGFAPRFRANNKMNMKTMLIMIILKILSEKVDAKHYGQKIIEEIESRLEVYKPSPGVIYPILNTLELDGYIKGHWEDPSKKSIKRYRITDEGLVKLNHLCLDYKSLIKDEIKLYINIAKVLKLN